MAKVGRYELERELGRGAMGVVYLAHDPRLERPVAVKCFDFPAGVSAEQGAEIAERFLREARAAAVLSHPAILTVYDVGEDAARGGAPFIAMEYVDGHTLQYWIDRLGKLEPDQIFPVVDALADALETAHASGIVHRDVKPANVLIREPDGAVKIADFGVARLPGSDLTLAGATLGTPAYMSPEEVRGQPAESASDLFSLAVILYECLCGERPFSGEDLATLTQAVALETPAPISRRVAGLPPAIDAFFDRALAKDPAQRYPTGAAFREALDRVRSGAPAETLVVDVGEATVANVDMSSAARVTSVANADVRPAGRAAVVPLAASHAQLGARQQNQKMRLVERRRVPAGSDQPIRRDRRRESRTGSVSGARIPAQIEGGGDPVRGLQRHWPLALVASFASLALIVAIWQVLHGNLPGRAERAPSHEPGVAAEALAQPATDPPRRRKDDSANRSRSAAVRAGLNTAARKTRTASVNVSVKSRVPNGVLTLLVDRDQVLSRRLSAPADSTKLTNRLRGRAQETFETSFGVSPGVHRIVARMRTGQDGPDEEGSVTIDLKAGETRSIRIVAGRVLGDPLSIRLE